jgi:large subunit ribosomal protein L16
MKKLIPSNTKYKKYHKGTKYNRVFKHNKLKPLIGSVGLKFKIGGRITSAQINSTQLTLSKYFKKTACIRIHGFAFFSITKKPIETRMGKGKGAVDHWVFCAKPGFLFLEIIGSNRKKAVAALRIVQNKLPLTTLIVHCFKFGC